MPEPCQKPGQPIPQSPCVPSRFLNVLLLFYVLSAVGVSYFIAVAFRSGSPAKRPRGRPKGKAKAQSKRKATPKTAKKRAACKAKAKASPKAKAACKAKAKSKAVRKPKSNGKCQPAGKAKASKAKNSKKELKQDWNNIYSRMYHALRRKGSSKDEARLVFIAYI